MQQPTSKTPQEVAGSATLEYLQKQRNDAHNDIVNLNAQVAVLHHSLAVVNGSNAQLGEENAKLKARIAELEAQPASPAAAPTPKKSKNGAGHQPEA